MSVGMAKPGTLQLSAPLQLTAAADCIAPAEMMSNIALSKNERFYSSVFSDQDNTVLPIISVDVE
jgi:hypothetical protein